MAIRQFCISFIFLKIVSSASITKDVQSPPINEDVAKTLEPKPLFKILTEDAVRPAEKSDSPKIERTVEGKDLTKQRIKRNVNFEEAKQIIKNEVSQRKKRNLLILGGKLYSNVYVEYYTMEHHGKFYVCKITTIGSHIRNARCLTEMNVPEIILPSSEEIITSSSSSSEEY